jgi:hypothetical protein
MKMHRLTVLVALICAVALMFALGSCGKKKAGAPQPPKGDEIASFRLNTMNGILATANASIDESQSADSTSKGALKIEAPSSMTVKLVQTGPLNVNDVTLIYRATFRSKELSGRAYLLMTVRWADSLETFARGFEQAIIGSVPWVTEDITYNVERKKKVDNVTLGMVIEGTGTVWVNDVKLLKTTLKKL